MPGSPGIYYWNLHSTAQHVRIVLRVAIQDRHCGSMCPLLGHDAALLFTVCLTAWEGRLEEEGRALKEQEQALQEQEAARQQRHKEREAEFARSMKEREAALSKEQGALNKRDNQQMEEDQRLKAEATRLQVGPTAPQHSDRACAESFL